MNTTQTFKQNLKNIREDLEFVEDRRSSPDSKNKRTIQAMEQLECCIKNEDIESLECLLRKIDYEDQSFVRHLSENEKVRRYYELSCKDCYSDEETHELDRLLEEAEQNEELAFGFGFVDHQLAHELGFLNLDFRRQYKQTIDTFVKQMELPADVDVS